MARRASRGTNFEALRGRPFLREVRTDPARVDPSQFPFTIPAFSHGIDLTFERTVTFFVGENGTGKSTLLEAIALNAGFNPQGGSRDHRFGYSTDVSPLASALQLAWTPKVTAGFFMRAETFFNFASYIDEVSDGDLHAYGGKSLKEQSHGESGATVLSLDGEQIEPVDYRETKHYLITKQFLDAPERYFKHLFSDEQRQSIFGV